MTNKSDEREGLLAPYRVLDLTDEKGFLAGKIFGDLGADVIKIEKPGGDRARCIGPFYKDIPDPEKSLYWFAFNRNKRGITLDIQTADGQSIFKNLVGTADFVIESFPPGFMDKLGLGYEALSKINPRIIMASISPYGQKGPRANYAASELTLWAMGGMYEVAPDVVLWVYGSGDRLRGQFIRITPTGVEPALEMLEPGRLACT